MGRITTDEALEILENSEISRYVPQGHTFTVYTLDEIATVFFAVLGAIIIVYALYLFIMRAIGGANT